MAFLKKINQSRGKISAKCQTLPWYIHLRRPTDLKTSRQSVTKKSLRATYLSIFIQTKSKTKYDT